MRRVLPRSPQVREAGGLLVLGTSLQESRRFEQQLRGRAGRQGDPGARPQVPASFGVTPDAPEGMSYERARAMARWCVAAARKMRKEVVKRVHTTFGADAK